jgi:hypothetical protein
MRDPISLWIGICLIVAAAVFGVGFTLGVSKMKSISCPEDTPLSDFKAPVYGTFGEDAGEPIEVFLRPSYDPIKDGEGEVYGSS